MTAFQAARSSPRPASRLVSGYRPASAIAGSAPTTMQSTGLLKLARLVTLPPLTSNGTVASILPANRPEVSVRAGSGTGLAGSPQASTANAAPVYTQRLGQNRTSSGHRNSTASAGYR